MNTPTQSQAVEAAVQQIMELADTFCNASDSVVQMLGANAGMDEGNVYWVEMKRARSALETALRAELTSQQEVAAPVSDEQIEQAARYEFNGGLDWTNEGNLLASAVQRAYFRFGAKWALAASRAPVASLAEPVAEVMAEGDTIRLKHRLPRGTKLYTEPAGTVPLSQGKQDQGNLAVADSSRAQGAEIEAQQLTFHAWLATKPWQLWALQPAMFAAYRAGIRHQRAAQPTPPVPGGTVAQGEAVTEAMMDTVARSIEYRLWIIKEWASLHLGASHNITITANSVHSEVAYSKTATPANMAVGAGGDVGAVEKHEWLQESSYRAGAKAGFNLGIAENHEGLHALLAAHQYPRPTPEQATPPSVQGVTDAERLDWLANEYVTAEPFAMPTPGGDDADVGWRLTHEVQGKREPVEIHTEYRDDLRAAIDAAILSTGSHAGVGESEVKS